MAERMLADLNSPRKRSKVTPARIQYAINRLNDPEVWRALATRPDKRMLIRVRFLIIKLNKALSGSPAELPTEKVTEEPLPETKIAGPATPQSPITRKKKMNTEEWKVYLRALAARRPPGTPITPVSLAGVSDGTATAVEIKDALRNHSISRREIGMADAVDYRSTEEWLAIFQGLKSKFAPGARPTPANYSKASDGKFSKEQIITALQNHEISYKRAGMVEEYRTTEQWRDLIDRCKKMCDLKFPPGTPYTAKNLASVSAKVGDALTASELIYAIHNHDDLTYENTGVVKERPGRQAAYLRRPFLCSI